MTAPLPLIAHVVHRFDVGGMENGLVNLLNRMPPGRFRHAVVSLTGCTRFAERLEQDVTLVELDKKPGNDPRLYFDLWKVFRRLKPSIVHTRNLATIEAVVPAALARVPCRIHGEHGRDVQDPTGTIRRYRWLRRALTPWIDRYVALSGDLEEYLVERVGVPSEKVVRIRNGVDAERFRPLPAGRTPVPPESPIDTEGLVVIGSITRMEEIKAPVVLARAFVLLVERGYAPKARLVMVGDGALRSRVAKVLQEADAMPYAWLAGNRDDIPDLLRSFDIFALSSRVEGISNTVLEAMASGLPVVATRVGGNSELVDDGITGTLVPSDDPERLAHALAAYIDDPARRLEEGRRARERVESDLGLEGMVARYLELYEDILARKLPEGREPREEETKLRCAE